jgi:cobalt/nickel transport system permease protein
MMMLLHIGTFHLAIDERQKSPWHDLAPRTRVLCAGLFVFANALTANGHWWTWLVYGLGLLVLIRLSHITGAVFLRRVVVEFLFIGVVLLGTLFRPGETTLFQWGWIHISQEGLTVLGSVSLKAFLSLMMLNLLVLTTPIPALLHALRELRVPPLLVAILAAMYRYIGVLVSEFTAMRRAALSRNLMTYERGDRIHQAMLARGYTGLPPIEQMPPGGKADILALTLILALLGLGQLIYWR